MKKFYGVILAAGFSSRYPIFKPLARYKEKYYLQLIIEKMAKVCYKIIVVTGFREQFLKEKISRVLPKSISDNTLFCYNKNFAKGMFTSIQSAASYLKEVMSEEDLVMIHLVDQPHIMEETYRLLIKAANSGNSDAYIPSYKMKAGHPIIVNCKTISKICNSASTITLRDVLKNIETSYITVSDRNILKDIDIIADEKSLE